MSLARRLPCLSLLVLVSLAAPALRAQREKLPEEDLAFVEKNFPDAKKTSTGMRYIVQAPGTGEVIRAGDMVSVIYAVRLLNGTIVDQNINREKPFTFRVGRDVVIAGWDQIMQEMKLGERRLVIVPSELAYGMRGQPPRIPRDATLVFLIEVLDIKREE